MSLKRNLIELMKSQCITIKELAHKTGISEPTLKRLRTADNSNPTLDILIKLSTTLGVSLPQLIEEEKHKTVIFQNNLISLDNSIQEFVYVFTENTFNFAKGTKAIFKRYIAGSPITRFIINDKWQLLEKVDEAKLLFRNDEYENFSISCESISAYIVKELFEVNYV